MTCWTHHLSPETPCWRTRIYCERCCSVVTSHLPGVMFLTLKETKKFNNHPVSLFPTCEWAICVHTWPFNSCTAGRAEQSRLGSTFYLTLLKLFFMFATLHLFRLNCAVFQHCAYVLVLLSQTWLENVLTRCQDTSSGFRLLHVEPALSGSALITQPGFERTCGLQKPWMQTFYRNNWPVRPILWNRKWQT